MTDFAFLWDTLTRLLTGVPLTLKLASGSVALGAVLALLLTAMRMSPVAVLSWLARIYVFVFRGTPLLVQIFLIYYGLGQFPEIRQSLLWPFLRERTRAVTDAETAFIAETDAWLADERSPRVDVLQDATGLSARQVARLCNRYYGAPPKYLARKYRALRSALILARDNVDWADLCDDTFYDQSHFIREFKHFIGLTPNQLRDDASLVIRLTMNRRDVEGDFAHLSRIS